MPEEVLTGPFIEFGKSLWRSDRLPTLYPGLASNPRFNPTGQFGIGFYASFMIGNNIKIMTKPYNGGDSDRRVLHFESGVRGRAELRAYDSRSDTDWPHGQNTIVEISFNSDEWLAQFASMSFHGYFDSPIYATEPKFWEFFALTLKRLVFCLDVVVKLNCPQFLDMPLNRTDVFQLPNDAFAEEFNRIFDQEKTERFPVKYCL